MSTKPAGTTKGGTAAKRKRRARPVRLLPSGRWQARVTGPDGVRRTLGTYETEAAAYEAVDAERGKIATGAFLAPSAETVESFAVAWLTRPQKRPYAPNTLVGHEKHLRLRILPALGHVKMRELTPAAVTRWYASLPANTTRAGAYAVLHAVCAYAVRQEVIARNPCMVDGGGSVETPERSVIGIAEVFAIADAIHPHYRELPLLGAFANGRFAEVRGLMRKDWNAEARLLTIDRQLIQRLGHFEFTPCKSRAGHRTLPIPEAVAVELDARLASGRVGPEPDALIFTGHGWGAEAMGTGKGLYTPTFSKQWAKALDAVRAQGVEIPEGFRFHDLRHTGNTLVAKIPGITVADMMARLGDSTPKMALHYLHADEDAKRLAADGLQSAIEAAMPGGVRGGEVVAMRRRKGAA